MTGSIYSNICIDWKHNSLNYEWDSATRPKLSREPQENHMNSIHCMRMNLVYIIGCWWVDTYKAQTVCRMLQHATESIQAVYGVEHADILIPSSAIEARMFSCNIRHAAISLPSALRCPNPEAQLSIHYVLITSLATTLSMCNRMEQVAADSIPIWDKGSCSPLCDMEMPLASPLHAFWGCRISQFPTPEPAEFIPFVTWTPNLDNCMKGRSSLRSRGQEI